MAVARAPVGGGMTGIKVALIVFVCLTVASITLTVIMFTRQTDLETGAAADRDRAQKAGADKSKAQQELGEFARRVTGEILVESPRIEAKLDAAVGQKAAIWKDPGVAEARIAPDSAVLTVLQRLFSVYQNTATLLAKTAAEKKELVDQLAALNQAAEQRAKDFDAKTNDFQQKVAQLEQANAANQQAWTQQVEDLKRRLEASTSAATATLGNERQSRQKLEKQLDENKAHAKELAEKLARFQPGMDTVSPEQIADATVVRSVPTESIAYIGLGKNDRITPGMPFTVYSRPRAGGGVHEKGTLEVANVFDTTSECRVKSTKVGDPIIEGDLVGNLVYDKNRRYRFVVAGDFDLNFDGKIDPVGGVGGQDVAHMIERWGGQVVPTLDSSVDFVVLGAPPAVAAKLSANAPDDLKQRVAEQAKTRQAFETIRADAKAMSIPILTRTQFLHFIGMQLPPRTPEDQLAAQ